MIIRSGAGACSSTMARFRAKSSGDTYAMSSRQRAALPGAAPTARPRCTDPDAGPVLHWLGVAPGLGEGEELALVVRDLLGPEQADHLDRLAEATKAGGR